MDSALARAGYRQVARANAALLIHYHVGVRNRTDTLVVPPAACAGDDCWTRLKWGYWGEPERNWRITPYTEGRLMIDVLAGPALDVAWRGVATGLVSDDSMTDERITKIVNELLKRFPDGD